MKPFNKTGYIKLNSNDYADAGTLYKVIEYRECDPVIGTVELLLELQGGQKQQRVVPQQWVEWIPDGEW